MIRQFFNQMNGPVTATSTSNCDRSVFFALLHKSRQHEFDQFRELLLNDVKDRVGSTSYEQIGLLLRDRGVGEIVQDVAVLETG